MPSGLREQAEAEPEAGAQTGAQTGVQAGIQTRPGGSKIKLESRAADLKKLLLGKRQKVTQLGGRRPTEALLLSPTPSAGVSSSARQVFSDSDIGDLIADLLPPRPNVTKTKDKTKPAKAKNNSIRSAKGLQDLVSAANICTSPTVEISEQNAQANRDVRKTASTRTVSTGTVDTAETIVQTNEPVIIATDLADKETNETNKDEEDEANEANEASEAANEDANEKSGDTTNSHKNGSSNNNKNNNPFVGSSASTIGTVGIQNTESITMSPPVDPSTGVAIQKDKDLQDWLVFTNYYDVAYRNQFLTRRRRLAALEAERLQLLEEEKEEATMTAQRQFTPAPMTAQRQFTPAPMLGYTGTGTQDQQNTLLLTQAAASTTMETTSTTATAPVMDALTALSVNHPDPAQQTGAVAKRTREANEPVNEAVSERPGKVARVENRTENLQSQNTTNMQLFAQFETNGTSVDNANVHANTANTANSSNIGPRPPPEHERARGRDTSPLRPFGPPGPPGPPGPNWGMPPPPVDRDRNSPMFNRWDTSDLFDSHRNSYTPRTANEGNRRYRSDRSERGDHQRSQSLSRSMDLGQRGDNRFFILKSFNEGNVRKAMADGVWTTQMKNEDVLVEAFSTCRNVVLFFSVNKSRAFQGYARMMSLPSAQTYRPPWMDGIHWETTEPFGIEWCNTFTTDFRHVAHFVNEFNDRRSVIIGKDGQEIDESCGRRLMEEMDTLADERDDMLSSSENGRGRGRGRSDTYRRSPSLASRITGGRR